ncbi:IS3 family transposase [Microbulbifer celer]|uniref:IS3 family transposase n=1 Tax=Microbulbifer celer TaxID=435905 RepID=UPI001E5CDBA3|nr:IS3 family transposase [Microbulbifer celer]UFN58121.1 IS3 family transposase [Microbulbifer celer]
MPKCNNPKKTWKYSNEFKVKAVLLSLIDGVRVKEVAATLDIHPFMLSRWRKEYRDGKIVADKRKKLTGVVSKHEKELSKVKRLEAENRKLKQEVDLPKKVATVSCGGTSARYRFIQRFGQELGIRKTCEWLGVSRSGYYDWVKRPLSGRKCEDEDLKTQIQQIFDESAGRYGSPRIWKALQNQGYEVSRKRVARLMQEMGLIGRVTRVTRRAPGVKRFLASGDNLRSDGAVPSSMNQVWVADVTYLKVKGQWHYLSAIMDLHSRRVVGWSLDTKRTTELTRRTLANAVRKRGAPPGLMLHTDRGVEYRGSEYQKDLKRYGIQHSLSRPGKCTDNAHMESFFHSLKAELIRGTIFHKASDLKYALARYINDFYNRKRLHSALDYQSPMEYERIAA